MREADFLHQLLQMINSDVPGMDLEQRTCLIQAVSDRARSNDGQKLPTCRIVHFVTGRRPTDEAAHPGLGSSDNTSMIYDFSDPEMNKSYILFELAGLEQYTPEEYDSLALDVTLSFAGTDDSQQMIPIPGWDKRPIVPKVFEKVQGENPALSAIPFRETAGRNLVFDLSPESVFLPIDWSWEESDPQIQQAATDFSDPFTFGHLFSQVVHISIRLTHGEVPVAVSRTVLDVCDGRRFGSLYQRIMDRLLKLDIDKQAELSGVEPIDVSYHPWFPVLLIGSDKSALYTDALIDDIIHKKRHLADPRWLMRVGLYLELLTCIGIIEVAREELGDLLSPAERNAYEHHPFFAEIRARLNPEGWREAWQLREVSLPRFGVPQTGPVSALNLLQKKRATLAFLQVHHDDLKNAIELAGKNEYYAQETWGRVFRDAERAVLRQTRNAFPELGFVDDAVKDFVLWYQKGKGSLTGTLLKQVAHIFGDQDGLYASARNQYRASMNEVAEWAKHRGLMDFTGKECVPERVSLLQARMERQYEDVVQLQRRDGYNPSLDVIVKRQDEFTYSSECVFEMLSAATFFRALTEEERRHLANTARELLLGPMERVVIEGRPGSSLFLVGSGSLEVLIRQPDGTDEVIDVKSQGDIVGEASFLTGAARTATVRARESVKLYEIGKRQCQPIIESRPEVIDELAAVMAKNLSNIDAQLEAYSIESETSAIKERIRRFFLGK